MLNPITWLGVLVAVSWWVAAYAFFGTAILIVKAGRLVEGVYIWFFRVTLDAEVKRVNLLGSPWKPD